MREDLAIIIPALDEAATIGSPPYFVLPFKGERTARGAARYSGLALRPDVQPSRRERAGRRAAFDTVRPGDGLGGGLAGVRRGLHERLLGHPQGDPVQRD